MSYRQINVCCVLWMVLWVALGYDAIVLLPAVLA